MPESDNPQIPPGLLAPIPRRVRMSPDIRQVHITFLSVLLGIELLLFGGVWLLNRYYFVKPIAALQSRGVKAEGKVTSITSSRIRGGGGSYQYTAHFEFPIASGGTQTGTFGAGPGHTQVGDAVPVIYLPDDPSQYIIAQEVTDEHFRGEDNEHHTGFQMAMILGGGLAVLMSLILLPSLWSDLREVRFARWAELVMGEVVTLTDTGYIYAYELPKLGRIEENVELGFFPKVTKVGQQIPILYWRSNPRWRKPVSQLSNVEFLPPKH
ncbi:DUF3592 domain-containing protein [bacterium]|nr:DUF3592 domain-containing protein [bacterium]